MTMERPVLPDVTHCLPTERALIGLLLQHPSETTPILAKLQSDSFEDPTCRAFFGVMKAHSDGLDQPQIVTKLVQQGFCTADAAAAKIAEFVSLDYSVERVNQYADEILEASLRRQFIAATTAAITEVRHNATPFGSQLAQFEACVVDLVSSDDASGRALPIGDLIGDVVTEALGSTGAGVTGLDTGFPLLNALTGGLQRGQVAIVGGRPSTGKTTFLMNVALHAAGADKLVLFVSAEMPGRDIIRNVICRVGEVDSTLLRTAKLPESGWNRVTQAADTVANLPLFICSPAVATVLAIKAEAQRIVRQRGRLDLVVVDYLQLLASPEAETREQQVAAISRALKQLARNLDCPVLAAAQLNRASVGRNSRPTLADLRESGAIEQDADLVVLLHEVDPRAAQGGAGEIPIDAIVDKNRNGERRVVRLRLTGRHFRFAEDADQSPRATFSNRSPRANRISAHA